jgi:hypothetical protein
LVHCKYVHVHIHMYIYTYILRCYNTYICTYIVVTAYLTLRGNEKATGVSFSRYFRLNISKKYWRLDMEVHAQRLIKT